MIFEEAKQLGYIAGQNWTRAEATAESLASVRRHRADITLNKPGVPHGLSTRMFWIVNPDPEIQSMVDSCEDEGAANEFWGGFAGDLGEEWYPAFALGFVIGALDVCDQDRP